MSKIASELRLGEKLSEEGEQILSIVSDMYNDIAAKINNMPDIVIRDDQAPTSNDYLQDLGTLWLNRDLTGGSPTLYAMVDKTASSATWDQLN